MKFTCEREKLLARLPDGRQRGPDAQPQADPAKPQAGGDADRAILMGTDLEVGIRIDVPGIVDRSRPAASSCRSPASSPFCGRAATRSWRWRATARRSLVRGQRSEFQLPSENPDEFPMVAAFQEEKYHEMPARFFREIVRRTVFATDNESSRYALGGVLVELTGDQITAVATDGRRLARQEGPAKSVGGHQTGDRTTIIPTRAMQLLERALADNDENIQLGRARQRRAGEERPDDDLLAAGRGAVSQVARCLSAAREQRARRTDRRAVLRGGPPGGDRHQRGTPRRRFHLRRRARLCWPPTAPNMASRTSNCPSPTTAPR